MELRDYIRILHKNWIVILVLLIVGLAGGAGYAAMQAPKYVASTQLYVSVRTEGAATGDLVQGTTFARQIVTSYVDVIGTALVLDPVVEELGLDTTASALSSQISATTALNTVLIDITVTDTDPKQAAAIADATAASFANVVQTELERPDTEGGASPVQITITDPQGKIIHADAGNALSFSDAGFTLRKAMPTAEHYYGLGDKTDSASWTRRMDSVLGDLRIG